MSQPESEAAKRARLQREKAQARLENKLWQTAKLPGEGSTKPSMIQSTLNALEKVNKSGTFIPGEGYRPGSPSGGKRKRSKTRKNRKMSKRTRRH